MEAEPPSSFPSHTAMMAAARAKGAFLSQLQKLTVQMSVAATARQISGASSLVRYEQRRVVLTSGLTC